MSHIDQLIKQYCPDGVGYRPLSEVGTFVRGGGLQKTDFVENGVPCIHYGQIYTYYGIFTYETKSFVSETTASKLKKAPSGSLVITTTSENVQDVCKSTAWLGDGEIAIGGHSCVFIHELEPKYAAYVLRTSAFQDQKNALVQGTKVKDISLTKLGKILIPVPPIEVQREIVAILDKFTQLEAELEAELEARRKQYEYYRNEILSFKNVEGGVRWITVSDICEVTRGRVMSKDYLRDHPGNYHVYSSQTQNNGIFGLIDTYDFDFESITWTTDGANAGSVFYHENEEFSLTNVCGLLRVLDPSQVSTRYVYYQLGFLAKSFVSAGMGNPKLMANAMKAIKIPVPALADQNRIVEVLNKFDALTNDISSGLPAEIEARRKQYEYYRDQLLSFRELDVA